MRETDYYVITCFIVFVLHKPLLLFGSVQVLICIIRLFIYIPTTATVIYFNKLSQVMNNTDRGDDNIKTVK